MFFSRNGYPVKRLKGQHSEVLIESPRDRDGAFKPQFVRKGQSRLTQMDDQILALYTKALNTRDIVDAFKEMYDADISATLVFKVTERVIDQVHEQQNRPVDPIYPIVYLDCIVLKIRQDKRVIDKSLYLALEPEGTAGPVSCRNRRREVLDVGTDETEDPWSGGHPDRLRGRS